MRIAIDAMGGDHAPEAVVEGTVLARSHCPADLVLVGEENAVREAFGRIPGEPVSEIVHAPQVIGMDEPGPIAIRRKRDSSLGVAMRMLADGEVDAVVSAGNTSAVVACAKHSVGVFPGLRRPALAVFIPTETASSLLLDAGAHSQAGAVHLAQSAVLAHIYLKVTKGLEKPRIGLLNIGREPGKGTKTVQRAFSMLKRSGLNFIGNIEPGDIFGGLTDAIICDGFVGNIVLKTYEGISEGLVRKLGQKADLNAPDDARGLRPVLETIKRSYDYQNVGGAPLLGIQKPVVVAHGRSESTAISSAILATHRMAAGNICVKMTEELERDSALADFKYFNALLLFENLKKKWGFAERR